VGDLRQNRGRFEAEPWSVWDRFGAEFSGFLGSIFTPFFGVPSLADLPVYGRFRDLRRRFWPVLDAFSNVLLDGVLNDQVHPASTAMLDRLLAVTSRVSKGVHQVAHLL
jgi:hypothetical protein